MGLLFPPVAVARAMKRCEIILKAMSGALSWIRAAEIAGMSARQMRRLKAAYQRQGYDGLLDRRTGRPSPKRAPFGEVQRILHLYREEYEGYNVRHFHQKVTERHGVTLGYTFVRKALWEAGLVSKRTRRGPHRRRRERRSSEGEMLHLDGSPHAWLALVPEEKQVLIPVLDDASSKVLGARLEEVEATETVLQALYNVIKKYGIPMSVYSDRASWAFYTPKAGGKVDKERLTGVGKVLAKLGVEAIPAYSPQARGRSERLNRTFQDRLINELRTAGIRTKDEANRYLEEIFIPDHNARYSVPPASPESAFVPVGEVDLDQIFCFEESRKVGKDNTVTYDGVRMQIEAQPGRATCADRRVTVRRHLGGHHSIWHGVRCLGCYDERGQALLGGTPGLSAGGGVDPKANAHVKKIESRPDLALKTSKPTKRGRNRWLPSGPGFSSLSPTLKNQERRKPLTGQIMC
jgi:transposase